jgi:hypothetical protein
VKTLVLSILRILLLNLFKNHRNLLNPYFSKKPFSSKGLSNLNPRLLTLQHLHFPLRLFIIVFLQIIIKVNQTFPKTHQFITISLIFIAVAFKITIFIVVTYQTTLKTTVFIFIFYPLLNDTSMTTYTETHY